MPGHHGFPPKPHLPMLLYRPSLLPQTPALLLGVRRPLGEEERTPRGPPRLPKRKRGSRSGEGLLRNRGGRWSLGELRIRVRGPSGSLDSCPPAGPFLLHPECRPIPPRPLSPKGRGEKEDPSPPTPLPQGERGESRTRHSSGVAGCRPLGLGSVPRGRPVSSRQIAGRGATPLSGVCSDAALGVHTIGDGKTGSRSRKGGKSP
jgi:hypothetical protein